MKRLLAALAILLTCTTVLAQSQGKWPNKPIRLITPFSKGGAMDIYSRSIAEPLSKRLKQKVVVLPIPGEHTITGTKALIKAAPDGYTFMITTMTTAVTNRFRVPAAPYSADLDFIPVTELSYGAVLMIAPASAPYSDAKGFIEWAKAQNRPLRYGASGSGSWGHVAGLILVRDFDLKLEYSPYKDDALAVTDVQKEALDVAFAGLTSARPRIAAGEVKAIAMTGPARSAAMPDLATFSEQGVPNVDLAIWVGAYAPPKTPKAAVARLQRELKAVLKQPEVRKKLLALGQTPLGNTPEEFLQNQRMDTLKWDALIRVFDIRIE
jgi:tripartite-type tricarboxylate transporter receptor subunit TctC